MRGALAILGGLVVFAFVDSWLKWASLQGGDWWPEIGPDTSAVIGSATVAWRTFGTGRWQ
ncbi:MAG TPA: hypothetical protein VF558_00760 [Rubrobacteraceae bacterium]